jgi:transposase
MPPCLIGMEACVGAHHLSRQLRALGHDARLMPAKYVRPYSKGQKNDFRDSAFDLAAAYKVAAQVRGLRRARGENAIGRKISRRRSGTTCSTAR